MHIREQYLKLKNTPFGELLTGQAHCPHPSDVTVPLRERFAGKTIIVINIALEKAGIVPITFTPDGTTLYGEVTECAQWRSDEGDFAEILRVKADKHNVKWVVLVYSTGWAVNIGKRESRPHPGGDPIQRWKHPQESPVEYVQKVAKDGDRVYGCVDHPQFQQSLVFSLSRAELHDMMDVVRGCGLGIASVRIGVASQLEVFFSKVKELNEQVDLVVTDSLSAVLVAFDNGNFVPSRGVRVGDQPRHSVRPKNVVEDIVRFIRDYTGDSVMYVGSETTCQSVSEHLLASGGNVSIVRTPGEPYHDVLASVVSNDCLHDLNPEVKTERKAVPRFIGKLVYGYLALMVVLVIFSVTNVLAWGNIKILNLVAESDLDRLKKSEMETKAEHQKLMAQAKDAETVLEWVSFNYHAQKFLLKIIQAIPRSVWLEKISGTADETSPQLTLLFVLRGDEEGQLLAVRQIERAVLDLRCRIGDRAPPASAGPQAVQYQWKLILPKEE